MPGPVFRVEPKLGPEAFKTYQILAPKNSHFRPASCKEVECAAWANGWQTTVNETTPLGQQQADYIRRRSGRTYKETNENGFTTFVFVPGQRCFAEHSVSLEREPLFLVRGGDFRGNPTGQRPTQHVRPEDWVEDFAEHQQGLADTIEKG
jgi:hypothetical protein